MVWTTPFIWKNPLVELHSHDGYLSSANFISEKQPGQAADGSTRPHRDLSADLKGARDPEIMSFKDHNADVVGSIDTPRRFSRIYEVIQVQFFADGKASVAIGGTGAHKNRF